MLRKKLFASILCLVMYLFINQTAFAAQTAIVTGNVNNSVTGIQGVTLTFINLNDATIYYGTTNIFGNYSVTVNHAVGGDYFLIIPTKNRYSCGGRQEYILGDTPDVNFTCSEEE